MEGQAKPAIDSDLAEIRDWVQRGETGFPVVPAPAYATKHGTPYLRTPGVALLARPQVAMQNLADFLGGFKPELNFAQYIDDPTPLPPAAQLCKTAGQICYASLGVKRTMNAEAERYFQNIKESGHGSVLEHAVFSFLFYGISRSVTHELIRHRAGFGYCLTGDVEVYSDHFCNGRREGVKKRSMAQLYQMTQTSHGRSRLKLLRVRCLDEATGLFTQGRVKAVVCSGIKPVFRIELTDGKSITCSKEHRFLTAEGWKPLEEIVDGLGVSPGGLAVYGNPDAEIRVNGIPAYQDHAWLHEHYIVENLSKEELAALAGVSTTTLQYWLRKHGIRKPSASWARWQRHNKGKVYVNKTWLAEHYCHLNLDQATIAELAGVSPHTIRSWIRKHGHQKPIGSWSKGRSSWNKGKRYQAGWHHSPETKQRFGDQKRGENNPHWKGGITPEAVSLRRGVKDLRPHVLARDAYRCRLCGQNSNKLTLHHILPIWARPDLALDVNNLASVCSSCHHSINGRELSYVELFGRSLDEISKTTRVPRGKGHLLVPRPSRVKSITYAGEQMTYDLEMEEPHHNFVANGIVTHNSQVSQRYVSGRVLRFVERPEYQGDAEMHARFERRIDTAAEEYEEIAERLLKQQKAGATLLSAEARTDLRKKVQQAARSVLPNETEAPIVTTANVRAWRHFIEMRANPHAEIEIRALAFRVYLCLAAVEPILFGDYRIAALPDGTFGVETDFPKV